MITDDDHFIRKISFKEIKMLTEEIIEVSNQKCPRKCQHNVIDIKGVTHDSR